MLFSSRPFHLQRHSMHASMHVFLTLYYVALCCGKFQYIWLYLHKIILHTSTYIWRFVHEHFANRSTSDQTKIFGCNCPNCSVLDWCDLPASSCAMGWYDLLPFDVHRICCPSPIAAFAWRSLPIVPDICWYFWWPLLPRRSRSLFDTSEFQLVVSNPRMIALTTPKVCQSRAVVVKQFSGDVVRAESFFIWFRFNW